MKSKDTNSKSTNKFEHWQIRVMASKDSDKEELW